MKYEVIHTNKILKQLKLMEKRQKDMDKFKEVVSLLAMGTSLPEKYKDHALKGRYKGYRDCHIEPDWILIYQIDNDKLILHLFETGTHSDLF